MEEIRELILDGKIKDARKMLILNFNFDDKKFPEIEAQFEFSNSLEQFFFTDLEDKKELLNEIIEKWKMIKSPIWFFDCVTSKYSKQILSV